MANEYTKREAPRPENEVKLEVGKTYLNLANVALIDVRPDSVYITLKTGHEHKRGIDSIVVLK